MSKINLIKIGFLPFLLLLIAGCGGPSENEIFNEIRSRVEDSYSKLVVVNVLNKQKEGNEYLIKVEYTMEAKITYETFGGIVRKGNRFNAENVYFFYKRDGKWVIRGSLY